MGSETAIEGERVNRGASGMAERVRTFDWSATPLGPFDSWPPELKTVVRHILESGFPSAVVWGPEYTTIYNDAFAPILGEKPDALGRSFADIWAEVWDQIGPIARRAYDGEATYIEHFPLVVDRHDRPEQAWFTFCYSPLRLGDGSVAGMIDTVVETTRTMQARTELDLLNKELGHRLKNTLALVQAIAGQTLAGVADQEAVAAFRNRMVALGHAHEILLQQDWTSAPLDSLVRETLAPHNGLQQIEVAGDALAVGSRFGLMLSLILHELATNAAKYGALSVPDGRVMVSWTVEGAEFRLHWVESGGPPVAHPSKTGFGSRLIARGLGSAGTVDWRYNPAGLEVDLSCPEADLH